MPTQEKTDDRLDGSTSEEDVGVVGESVNSSTTDHEDIMSGSHHPPEEERKENTMAEAVSGSNGATTEQAGDEKHRSLKTVPKPPDRKAEVPAGSASKAAIYKSSEEATTTASEAVKPASGKPGPPEESDRVQPELPGDENEKLAAKIADKNTSNDSHNNQAQDQAPLPTALRRENHISASATTPGAFAIAVTPTTPPTNDIMNVSQEEEGASTNNHISETAEEEGHSPFHTTSSNDDNNNSHSSTEEVLLSATLVPDSSPMNRDDMEEQQLEVHPLGEIMEAKPAPEGFRAIVSNKRFKYLLASFVSVVIVATVTPLALLIPKSKEKQSTQQVTVVQNTDRECGTRWLKQADYRGQVNVTETGKTCQRWDSQIPHSHVFNPDSEPGLEHNFCRNPGREPRA